jgi:dipeptidyl aminopeptidase/acylaminoacyl peptidase
MTNGGASASVKRPAVLFLHGGFATDTDDWDMNLPYRDAGYIVMMPILRGENGQRGDYTMFYDELNDVLAAASFLAARGDVDTNHLYLAGHSVGGTLAMLAAMTTTRFRAAASFSGSTDQIAWTKGQTQFIPFDAGNIREFQMRSPIAFATSFKCPVRLFYGSSESFFDAPTRRTAKLAKQQNLDVEAVRVPGDHFGAVPAEILQSIQFFQSKP